MEDEIVVMDVPVVDDVFDGVPADFDSDISDSEMSGEFAETEIHPGESEIEAETDFEIDSEFQESVSATETESVLETEIIMESVTESEIILTPVVEQEPVTELVIDSLPETDSSMNEIISDLLPDITEPSISGGQVQDVVIDDVELLPNDTEADDEIRQPEGLPMETQPSDDVVVIGDEFPLDAVDDVPMIEEPSSEVPAPDYTEYLSAIAKSLQATHDLESERYETLMSELTVLEEKQDVSSNNMQMLLTGVLLAAGLLLGVLVIKVLGEYLK